MFEYDKQNSISRFSIIAGIWFINILILIFGMPFLLFKKLEELFVKSAKKPQIEPTENQNSPKYSPCRN